MFDFNHTWPYEKVMEDLYFNECPFCRESSVMLNIKSDAIKEAFDGVKTHVVMPCCHEKLVIVSMDDDYIWSDRCLR
ncbi:hypothetical protein EV207_11910 [Scopulibacillus darangshiensis]|uniref:Uncharacterized protein n=1 Tax=Scopulibacillus darangshiensis TaxID=442528 RepID=A0A4R2NWV6_9BACL|nr:hypothetical protein [Scopulibacillus darangshiensis]TCP26580.1 hypothetical protein EV207_11910 [Scopulibacillus darangshiensis]